ncbi:MAG: peptidoglycan-associated lipoprotein [Gammaproteobacteria bacterium]|nr:MAG: peptidoglycan-associated lipoprotein [Gammaproteobacteria bacterium]
MRYSLIAFSALLITGCSTVPPNVDGSGNGQTNDTPGVSSGMDGVYYGGDGYNPNGASNTGYNAATNGDFYNHPGYGKNVAAGPRSQAKDRVIYFAYDSANIDARAEAIVKAHADYLRKYPNTKIVLEGHTDSRGSREYNIALGERRALSVSKRFQTLGVKPKQIRIISYGEENPAVSGYNESAYQRNRRAVIQY